MSVRRLRGRPRPTGSWLRARHVRRRRHRRDAGTRDACAVHRAARRGGRSGAGAPCRGHRRGAAACAGSATCPRPASMAIAPAPGSMRTPCPRRCRTAAGGGCAAEQGWRRLGRSPRGRSVSPGRHLWAGPLGVRRPACGNREARRQTGPLVRPHPSRRHRARRDGGDAAGPRERCPGPAPCGRRTRGERRRRGRGGAAAWRRGARLPVPFERAVATMSPMARSFWAEDRKVSSRRTQQMLGLRWRIRAIARDYAPSWPRSGASVRRSSARSCGRDRRWSPSFTRITSTSRLR